MNNTCNHCGVNLRESEATLCKTCRQNALEGYITIRTEEAVPLTTEDPPAESEQEPPSEEPTPEGESGAVPETAEPEPDADEGVSEL